jgi:hypothetical protein
VRDGTNLRCDSRRIFSDEMMVQWQELVAIANTITLDTEDDLRMQWQELVAIVRIKFGRM